MSPVAFDIVAVALAAFVFVEPLIVEQLKPVFV